VQAAATLAASAVEGAANACVPPKPSAMAVAAANASPAIPVFFIFVPSERGFDAPPAVATGVDALRLRGQEKIDRIP
jgi:hypothetical protein